jgi:hypothetical protein
MNQVINEILRSLGRIEGELAEIRKLSVRVSRLEIYQSWSKGLWAALAAGWAYLLKKSL